jgi:hypothetical protein
MKNRVKPFLILALVLGLGMARAASACYSLCVETSPSCFRCQNVGYMTGYVCYNAGTCGCKENFGVCPYGDLTALSELGISLTPQESSASAPLAQPSGSQPSHR